MDKFLKIIYLVIISFVLVTSIIFSEEINSDLESIYNEGLVNYYQKNYTKAVELFKTIQGINPEYRKSQIQRYIRSAEGQLGKVHVENVYKTTTSPTKEVEIKKEDELETFAKESQQVILDTLNMLNAIKEEKEISSFDLLTPTSTLKNAQEAYDKSKYAEAIRLANKARFQLLELKNKKTEKIQPLLGEIGNIPVTLNLTNASLDQTLKLIYDLTGANIVLSKGIEGRVNINVKDIPLKQVLDLICEANNLRYMEEKGVIKIMNEEEYKKRPDVQKSFGRRVFPIRYGDANSIVKALRETFKLDSIVYEPRTNSVIVDVGDPTLAQQVEEVISSLDTPISQVLIEAKLIELVNSKENTFGVDWLVSSRLIEKLGTSFTITGPRFGDAAITTVTPGVTSSLPEGFSFGITNSDVNMLIQALSTQGEVKLVQAPKIMCLNGTNAIIRVVQNYPYITVESQTIPSTTAGGTPTVTTTMDLYEEIVGTEFIVTPIIQRNRSVFLNLSIMDSRLVELKDLKASAPGGTTGQFGEYRVEDYPIVSSRETTQNVTLFDGQTLIVGGMIQEKKEKSETGVPLLKNIPLLGYLFKKPTYTNKKSELLLFLTPHVVSTYQEAGDLSKEDIEKAKKEPKAGIMEHF